MRARTIREGSVGLLILVGIGLFGGLLLWLRGFNPTNRPYRLITEFDDTTGVQVGTMVLYRGVPVGRVTAVTAESNSVDVEIEITQKDLRMPNQVRVETVESGLIGEMSIEITPLVELASSAADQSPVAKGCDSSVILCSGDRLAGVTGPSYEEFLRSASELTKLYADPELLNQLKTVLETVSETTADAGELAQEAIDIARVARVEIGPLSTSAKTAADSATRAAQQVEGAAQEFTLTATDINSLIGENRGTLVDTLGNVQAASLQLRSAADVLGPTLQSGELIGELEVLITNASAASEDLQAITSSLNTPANLVLLQQTLESAREALASAQKVMADVDEITGDPQVRNQLRNLINGLGELVSSTQSLEQQSEVARALVPLSEKIGEPLAQPTNAQVESQAVGSVETQSGIPVAVETGAARSIRQHPDASDGKPTLFFDGERYVVRFSQADGKHSLKRK
ncbi:MAG: MlaD family protein [Cyanobacteria bacterium J06634_5]